MAAQGDTYSRVVGWLKIILPLTALAILSTLFLVARTIDPADSIPFADVNIEELVSGQRISNPNYAGVTADGAAVRLAAKVAWPDPENPGRILGSQVDAGITLRDGMDIAIAAATVFLDQTDRHAGLRGDVVLTTSEGYRLRTEALDMALQTTRVSSDSETVVSAGFGTLSAGAFVLNGDGTTEKPYRVHFKDGVRLLYRPEG